MHPNPIYRRTDRETALAFARDRGFGTLVVNHDNGPLLSHIPFSMTDAARLEFHLVRSNPILRLLDGPVPAVVSVLGGDGYISPDWYGLENQVPTWNYVAVHLRGRLERLAEEDLHPVLERLSADFEKRIPGKKPWKIDKMDQEAYRRMQRQIVPVALTVETLDSTYKLGQNKPGEARRKAAAGLRATGLGSQTDLLADLMDKVPDA